MNTLSITLAAWNAWEQSSESPEDWTQIEMSGEEQLHSSLPKAQRIPPMLRRRLGSLGKAAIASSEDLVAEIDEPMPTVFCSQHGDLNRTLELLESLTNNDPLSPTQFSLSVHNAIAGIYSIARKDHSPTTALSCAQDDVSSALLETQLILQEQQCQYALCIVHDEPIPTRYCTTGLPTKAYAASFLLRSTPIDNAQQLKLSVGPREDSPSLATDTDNQPSALSLVKFLNQKTKHSLCLTLPSRSWLWQKDAQEQNS